MPTPPRRCDAAPARRGLLRHLRIHAVGNDPVRVFPWGSAFRGVMAPWKIGCGVRHAFAPGGMAVWEFRAMLE